MWGIITTMASKYKFNPGEKFGVWKTLDGKCFWCGVPTPYDQITIDHIIPEYLNNDPYKLKEIKVNYKLNENFEINNFYNWVPAHSMCNSKKGFTLYENSPVFLAILDKVSKGAKKAKETSLKILKSHKIGALLAKLESVIESGDITKAELAELKELFKVEKYTPLEPKNDIKWILNSSWSITREEGNIAFATNGKQTGLIPGKGNYDYSWVCPTCGNCGPWNGVICLSCGSMSDPND